MRILYNVMAIILTSVQLFCCAMDYDKSIIVETADQGAVIFKKSNINQSSVLSVLYAHQKKNKPYLLTVPNAREKNENITAEDVRALRDLLEHQDDAFSFYMNELSGHKIIHCAYAAYVLGAQRQLFQVINHLFTSDITKSIGAFMMSNNVQSYMIKQFIKKQEIADPYMRSIDDLIFSSDKRGSFFYMPLELLPYYGEIACDGISAFLPTFPIEGQDDLTIRGISSKCQYYVTGINNVPGDKPTLWSFEDHILSKNQTKPLGNEGKITQIVFSHNEQCVIVGSEGEENNLLFLKTEPFEMEPYYWLSGHTGVVSKIIVTDDGRYIVSAYKDVAEFIIWDMEYKTGQWLHDNYKHPITTMTFSKNDTQLWVCSGAIISLWQIADDGSIELFKSISLDDEDAIICRLLVNEQARQIIVGRMDGKINVFCTNTYKQKACLEGHKEIFINGLVSNDEGTIVVSSTNGIADNLKVWDIHMGECIANLKGHPGIIALLLTHDMRYIVSQSFVKTCLWPMYDESELETLQCIKRGLSFLHCYELYNLYKTMKNGYKIDPSKTSWVTSLPIAARVKEFVEKYLL